MVWEGDDIIALSRQVIGKTNVKDARRDNSGDFSAHTPHNLIHGSDSPESAQREIANFFEAKELVEYNKTLSPWL